MRAPPCRCPWALGPHTSCGGRTGTIPSSKDVRGPCATQRGAKASAFRPCWLEDSGRAHSRAGAQTSHCLYSPRSVLHCAGQAGRDQSPAPL